MGDKTRHIEQLKKNHRDLDEAIQIVSGSPGFSPTTLKLMRRQKLAMRQKLDDMSGVVAMERTMVMNDIPAERVAEAGVCKHQPYGGPKGHSMAEAGHDADIINLAIRLGNLGCINDETFGREHYVGVPETGELETEARRAAG